MTGSFCAQIAMPKQINEIKDFLLTARRKDAKCASVPAPPYGARAERSRCACTGLVGTLLMPARPAFAQACLANRHVVPRAPV